MSLTWPFSFIYFNQIFTLRIYIWHYHISGYFVFRMFMFTLAVGARINCFFENGSKPSTHKLFKINDKTNGKETLYTVELNYFITFIFILRPLLTFILAQRMIVLVFFEVTVVCYLHFLCHIRWNSF